MQTDQPLPPGLRVAAVQLVSGSELAHNLSRATYWVQQAALAGARLVALPEYFCLMGRHDTDKLALDGAALTAFLAALAKRCGVWLVGGTVPLAAEPGRVFNSTLVFSPDGAQQARYDKMHLFAYDDGVESYDESRVIAAGRQPVKFDAEGVVVGLGVCYDLRFPEIFRAMAPFDLLVLPAAFTQATGQAHWEILLRARAIENQCYVLASAQGGLHDSGRRTFGHSMLVDPWGTVLDVLPEGEGLVVGDCDPTTLLRVRQQLPALRHRVLC